MENNDDNLGTPLPEEDNGMRIEKWKEQ